MMDERFAWFYKDQEQTGQIQSLLVAEEDFETMINYFRTACVKNDLRKPAIVMFLDWFASRKDDLCIKTSNNAIMGDPLIESLEQDKKFDTFIERFFKAIAVNPDLAQ